VDGVAFLAIVQDFVLNVQIVICMEVFAKLSVRLATTAPLAFLVRCVFHHAMIATMQQIANIAFLVISCI
jgi:hypothetical protein